VIDMADGEGEGDLLSDLGEHKEKGGGVYASRETEKHAVGLGDHTFFSDQF